MYPVMTELNSYEFQNRTMLFKLKLYNGVYFVTPEMLSGITNLRLIITFTI